MYTQLGKDIKVLKILIYQLEILYEEYMSKEDDEFEIDYEDVAKSIFHTKVDIKSITDSWEE